MTDSQPSGRTWYRRATTVALVVYWLAMFAATHVPKIPTALEPGISDKWQHYVAYAGLGALLAAWWSARRRMTWTVGVMLLIVVSVYGAFDELTQPLFGRDAELLDWRSDVIGGATGLALVAVISLLQASGGRQPPEASKVR